MHAWLKYVCIDRFCSQLWFTSALTTEHSYTRPPGPPYVGAGGLGVCGSVVGSPTLPSCFPGGHFCSRECHVQHLEYRPALVRGPFEPRDHAYDLFNISHVQCIIENTCNVVALRYWGNTQKKE